MLKKSLVLVTIILTTSLFLFFFFKGYGEAGSRIGLLTEDLTGDVQFIYKLLFPHSDISVSNAVATLKEETIGNEFKIADYVKKYQTNNFVRR